MGRIILALLAKRGIMYAAEIARASCGDMKRATAWKSLARLELLGLVDVIEADDEIYYSGPPRKRYRITSRGNNKRGMTPMELARAMVGPLCEPDKRDPIPLLQRIRRLQDD